MNDNESMHNKLHHLLAISNAKHCSCKSTSQVESLSINAIKNRTSE